MDLRGRLSTTRATEGIKSSMGVFGKEGWDGDSAEIGCEKGFGCRVSTAINQSGGSSSSFGGRKKLLAMGGEKNRLHFFPFSSLLIKQR